MSSTPLLSGRNLRVGFGHGAAGCCLLGPVDFDLAGGEVVCLVGPNGAGKSTLLLGDSLLGWTAVERARKLAVVFPRLDAPDAMTGEDFVALGRIPHTGWTGRLLARDYELVRRALEITDSANLSQRFLGQLSDGERQRLGFARALAQEARLVVLDEPTAFLDVPHRVALFRSLREQARAHGLSILVSTHELDLARRHADRIWVLDGRGGSALGLASECESELRKAFGDGW